MLLVCIPLKSPEQKLLLEAHALETNTWNSQNQQQATKLRKLIHWSLCTQCIRQHHDISYNIPILLKYVPQPVGPMIATKRAGGTCAERLSKIIRVVLFFPLPFNTEYVSPRHSRFTRIIYIQQNNSTGRSIHRITYQF